MKVPFIDHTRHWEKHGKEYLKLFDQVLATGQYQGDQTTAALEEEIKRYTGRNAVMVNSGTEALYIALRAIRANSDAEVIVPAYSFPATASTVLRAGLKPVFVDVDMYGFINEKEIDKAITDKTAAIIPVSIFGRGGFIDERKYKDYFVIWDNAQGFSRQLCTYGFLNCISFDPMKVLPAFGSAGAILCDDEMMEWILRGLRKNDPYSKIPSQNSQVPSVLSIALLHSLENYHIPNKHIRRNIYLAYTNRIQKEVLDLCESFSTNHKFPIFHKKRDELKKYLEDNGIQTKVHYPYILPELEMFGSEDPDKYPMAKKLSQTELSLPIFPEMSCSEIDYVCMTVNKWLDISR